MNIDLLKFCKDIFKFPRSITGNGTLQTLKFIQKFIPELNIKKIKSGTKIGDWVIPPEWNIIDGYVVDLENNKKVIDFKKNNLHIIGYSDSIDTECSYDDLTRYLYTLEDQPNAIPYITSYYEKRVGFCISYNEYIKLNRNSKYKLFIDSNFDENGFLNYGEIIIKGASKKEIFLSTYICHPQMANDQLSGIAILTKLITYLQNLNNHYTYRVIFIPETIGSIAYINQNLAELKKNVYAGYVISCVGDEGNWSIIQPRVKSNISYEIAKFVLNDNRLKINEYSWLKRSSDERNYCAPNVDLPVSSISRSKHSKFPEYHTSLDNFNLVTEIGLNESYFILKKIILTLESSEVKPKIKVLGEPFLTKRGLYQTLSSKKNNLESERFMNFISFCDGEHSLIEISQKINCTYEFVMSTYNILLRENLI